MQEVAYLYTDLQSGDMYVSMEDDYFPPETHSRKPLYAEKTS